MTPDQIQADVTQLIAEARLSALSMEQHAATVHAERLLMVSAHQMRSTAAQLRKLATALTEAGERERHATVAALQEALSTTETEARRREREVAVRVFHAFDSDSPTYVFEAWLDKHYPLTPAKAEGEKT